MKITPDIAELMAIKMEGGHLSDEELQIVSEITANDPLLSEFMDNQLVPEVAVDSAQDFDSASLEGMLAMDFMDISTSNNLMNTINHDDVIGLPGNEYQQ